MKKILALKILLPFLTIILSIGCSGYRTQQRSFNRHYESNNLQEARSIAQKSRNSSRTEQLLWTLKLASIEKMEKNYSASLELYDHAEEFFRQHDLSSVFDVGAKRVYPGKIYDRILTNTYKGLLFMLMENDEYARVEFNRALQRQELAIQEYRREIQRLRNEYEEEVEDDNENIADDGIDKTLESDEFSKIMASNYSNIQHFQFYADYVNPFTTYLAGLFFFLERDFSRAVDLLKEAYAMEEYNTVIRRDFMDAENFHYPQNQAWIIIESGLGPLRESINIDIPLFLFTDKMYYTGIALPRLVMRDRGFHEFHIRTGNHNESTYLVSNMEKVIAADFEKELRATIIREIMKAGLFTYAQYYAQRSDLPLLAFGIAVAQIAQNQADIRIWSTLPREYYIGRIDIPENRILQLRGNGRTISRIELPEGNNVLVYVHVPTRSSTPVYHTRAF